MWPRWKITAIFCLLALESEFLDVGETYGFQFCEQYSHDFTHVLCVRCNIRNVTEAVWSLPNTTTHLNLTGNLIETLPPISFGHLPNLEHLRIDSNLLRSLNPVAFQGLTHLTFLNLSNNNMETIHKWSFNKLVNLTTLYLENNKISQLSPDVFNSLHHLKYLSLKRNNLSDFSIIVKAVMFCKTLQRLDLSNNTISSLTLPGNMENIPYSQLQTLNLAANIIGSVGNNSFPFHNISTLDLSYNRITTLDSNAFSHLPLKMLKLSGNWFPLSDLNPAGVQKLQMLHLSNSTIGKGQNMQLFCKFVSQTKIKLVALRYNGLKYLSTEDFSKCTTLQSLDLSFNSVCRLFKHSFVNLSNLNKLYLNGNQLHKIYKDSWAGLNNLQILGLRKNRIKTIEDYSFIHLEKLRIMDVSENEIFELRNATLSGLKNLERLLMDKNKILELHSYYFREQKNLRALSLHQNKLSLIRPYVFEQLNKLIYLNLVGNQLVRIYANAFKGLSSLKILILADNNLQKLHKYMFKGLKSLQHLDLSNNNILIPSSKWKELPPFEELGQLQYLNLKSQGTHGIKHLPSVIFKGLKSLQYLFLGLNTKLLLTKCTFKQLYNLTFLEISDITTGLRDLANDTFKGLHNLETLQLENIGLNNLPPTIFNDLVSLKILSLRFNNLKNISEDLLHNLKSLHYFNLQGNTLECSCANYWFKNWSVNSPTVQIAYLYNYTCSAESVYKPFSDLETSLCIEDGKLYFIITSIVWFFTILIPLAYKKFFYFRFFVYIVQSTLSNMTAQKVERGLYQCDAFLSYSSMDDQWVINELVPQLERKGPPFFKLCLHHRDFELGLDIFTNIENAVKVSRKTICIITRHYLESEWCHLELQLASLRLLSHHQDVLILVFLEELPDYRLSPYHKLRKLMKSKTYIKWPEDLHEQQIFWARLRKALTNCDSMQNNPFVTSRVAV
ncbi:toll-like receptor 13 [Heptranchias perlo]|uniref:toll-like receptor 13 n=1 Tax=Heptranchias perlo TaxID=212740 RepID=UPI00355A8E34